MKNVILSSSIFIFSVSCTLTTTTPEQQGPKQAIGTVTGMVIGGKMANDFAEGSRNEGLWTMFGVALGAFMGNEVGAALDKQDVLLAERATMKALNTINPNKLVVGKTPIVEILELCIQQIRIVEEVSHVENSHKR